MPEIGEVARIVSYIQKHLVGKTLATVKAQHDENVFGKVGCSAEAFEKALKGKKVVDARQQGKYFWMVMSSPPHPLMHFGMAGWFKIRDEETAYYKPAKPDESREWPPKYWKFALETAEKPICEAAFVDFRRFARIRLLDCAAEDIRRISPLVENGPDPVIDKDIFTEEWLAEKLGSKKIPVKALMLDQANISGIGNWVGDEVLYDAKIHPEQYSNTLSSAQAKQLHQSIQYVCGLSVDTLADSSKFPEEWLFKHRWGKGKKDITKTLPNGSKFVHLTVGGRTSCVVPSVQKKTGPVKKDVEEDLAENGEAKSEEEAKPAKRKREPKVKEESVGEDARPAKRALKSTKQKVKQEEEPVTNRIVKKDEPPREESKSERKQHKATTKAMANGKDVKAKKHSNAKSGTKTTKTKTQNEVTGRRRSTRKSGGGI